MDCLYNKSAPVDTQERIRLRFCPAGLFPASDEQIEEVVAAISPPRPQPIPRDQWPWPARIISRLRNKADKGIGDTLQRLFAMAGGEVYKEMREAMGKPCSCEDDQAWLNAVYPY